MYDFLRVSKEFVAKQQRYVYKPEFILTSRMKDLMVRSNDFYAIYNYDTGFWVTNEAEAIELIDAQVEEYVRNDVGEQIFNDPEHGPIIKKISVTTNRLIKTFHNFCRDDVRDNYISLNQKVMFSNSEVTRKDYTTRTLDYPLEECPTPYYDKLMNRLYPPSEREKIEWSLGCVLANEQSKIQKLFVFFGPPGSGKSTVIDKIIVDNILGGSSSTYTSKFTSHLLAMRDSFATGFLEKEPLVAYDDDADLSRIDDNATLNMIVSHEMVRVNQKFKRPFDCRPNCILYLGTNEPVQLGPNSGLNRRLIDIRQTGDHLPPDEYDDCIEHIKFERSGIAYQCLQVYKSRGKNFYNHYQPEEMLSMTSPFHNFVKDNYYEIRDGITLSAAYDIYKQYCIDCSYKTVITRYKFRDQLKLYFDSYDDLIEEDGHVCKNYFSGFKSEKIGLKPKTEPPKEVKGTTWLKFNCTTSLFDTAYGDYVAQYAKEDGSPEQKWAAVTTLLRDLDTSRLHWVKLPEYLIVIDFDIKDETGNKSFEKNLEAASKFPPTYAELSKSGAGIHLHYIWTGGDPNELSRVCADNVEVKVFTGNASLRRMLTRCNDIPVAEINCGLPLKEGGTTMPTWEGLKNESILRSMIIKNLRKEYHANTKPSMDYIDKLLTDAYRSGMKYDVRDLDSKVLSFAMSSTHKADYCVALYNKMHFCSKDYEDEGLLFKDGAPIIFLDVEVFPNLFVICWKYQGEGKTVIKMINPSSKEVRDLFKYRIIGFNNRKYDNHILYAAAMGYSPNELFKLSQKIIGEKTGFFSQAYNLSYTDVLDFLSSGNKMSLKKWEYRLKNEGKLIEHKENEYPWDKPVDKAHWEEIADYCANDVIATEAVFDENAADWHAREILAEWSGLTVNDTTNSHTVKIITGGIDNPQKDYIYTDLSTIFPGYRHDPNGIPESEYNPGTKIVKGRSIYRGEDPGEGGYAIGFPGGYWDVALLDVSSMHPHSAIKLKIFGEVCTSRFEDIVEARVAIKHKDYDEARRRMPEKLWKYLDDPKEAKNLANALKTAINSVYGLTSASFDNKLRDPRNVDNIVAKYGALFMINLKHEVQDRGYTVVHIKTDSIKIANADPAIISFCMDYGKQYGYTFEHEATYDRMCIVNDAVYIAKYASKEKCQKLYDYIPEKNQDHPGEWTATGDQFKVPYVFKTLFSHDPIEFKDMCEIMSVTTSLYLDMNENLPEGEHNYKFVGRVGQFTPIISGGGGGLLLRKGTDKNGDVKFSAATGTKGYRWLESDTVKLLGKEDCIDRSYYTVLVDNAVRDVSEYVNFEEFVADDSVYNYIYDTKGETL